jgi:hypothetical protein
MWKRTIEFSPQETAEHRKRREAAVRQHDRMLVLLCNAIGSHRRCDKSVCRRNRACSDDPQPCFDKNWRALREFDRAWIRALIKAQGKGRSVAETMKAADAELNRMIAMELRLDAMGFPVPDQQRIVPREMIAEVAAMLPPQHLAPAPNTVAPAPDNVTPVSEHTAEKALLPPAPAAARPGPRIRQL